MPVSLCDEQRTLDVAPFQDRLVQVAEAVLAAEGRPTAEVSVAIVEDEAIRELNRGYRGKDEVTDVLSFSMLEEVSGEPPVLAGPEYTLLGDVIIAAGRARAQAEAYGHSIAREVCFLVAHGILHLLGHDHADPAGAARMDAAAEAALTGAGLGRG